MLVLRDVTITFRRYAGLLRQVEVPGVRGVSLRLAPGEVLALVGGSGAGKSLIAHA
ncbi:MAG TPA: ABC transporter ATP-binding protein, partial [Citreicella sp.]|nr:ABC transporter ATP-binding protein [Citreicella sp.]